MNDYFAPSKKPLDYVAFIEQLINLVERARGFTTSERNREDPGFRKWQHELDDLIERIDHLGHDVNTNLDTRRFKILGYGA